jgi:hypothetical protein
VIARDVQIGARRRCSEHTERQQCKRRDAHGSNGQPIWDCRDAGRLKASQRQDSGVTVFEIG